MYFYYKYGCKPRFLRFSSVLNQCFLKAQIKTNNAIVKNNFTADEIHRFSASDVRWIDNRCKPFTNRTVKKGEIYQFEFGKNYVPEMSYEHRGLVIGVKQNLLYVLPIFSYNPQKHTDVFHPIDFPNSRSNLFLLRSSEFSFISHDSVLKLNDIRTISVKRILYQQNGRIAPGSDTYKQIEQLTLQKYFSGFYYEYTQNLQAIENLNGQINELRSDLGAIQLENEKLKKEIELLKNRLDK